MDDRAGNVRTADGHRKAAECALVDKPQLTAAVVEGQAYPQVRLVGSIGWLDEQLATHAEMSEDRVTAVEREPQVLAAPARCLDPPPDEQSREVVCSGNVTADGARMSDRDVGDAPTHDPALEAAPDDLDLGKLRHQLAGGPVAAVASATRSTPATWVRMAVQADSAACCSASFLLRPCPSP